ncbi:hypothetical protein AA21952_0608 [Acetobacter oeni LMG 21952]|nr:hypothetical protein AA21952_0608 [Acetobacter oeni LMG 21952]
MLKCANCGTNWVVPAISATTEQAPSAKEAATSPALEATKATTSNIETDGSGELGKASPEEKSNAAAGGNAANPNDGCESISEAGPVPGVTDAAESTPSHVLNANITGKAFSGSESIGTGQKPKSQEKSRPVPAEVTHVEPFPEKSSEDSARDVSGAPETANERAKHAVPGISALPAVGIENNVDAPENPPSSSPALQPDSEGESEHSHFSFLDEALARDASENRTPQSPQMSVWDEAELEDQIAHSSWEQQHPGQHASLADEPRNLDEMEPEDLHALMQRGASQSEQIQHDYSGPGHDETDAGQGQASQGNPNQESFDDVVTRLRAARTGVADGSSAPETETPAPARAHHEPSAPWVPAWEREQPAETAEAEHNEDEELPVWARTAPESELATAQTDQSESAPVETHEAETRHVAPTVDIAARLRNDILQRDSPAPQSRKPASLLEQPEFWKKAWIASGVCAVVGVAVCWHWFGALRTVWPVLNLL